MVVNLLSHKQLLEQKEQAQAIAAEVAEEYAPRFEVIANSQQIRLERRLKEAGLRSVADIEADIEADREYLLKVVAEHYSDTGNKTLACDGGKISLSVRNKCYVAKESEWEEYLSERDNHSLLVTGNFYPHRDLTYQQALNQDIRTLYEADVLEYLKINPTAALAKAIPTLVAKGHQPLITILPDETHSISITLDKD